MDGWVAGQKIDAGTVDLAFPQVNGDVLGAAR
jgi:hypothetical protein